MNIDIKHNLLKNFLSDQRTDQRNVQTSIDQSMMVKTEQKSLEMDLRHEGHKNNDPRKTHKQKPNKINIEAKALLLKDIVLQDEKLKQQLSQVKRNPLKLLKVFSITYIAVFLLSSNIASGETIILTGDKWCPFNCDPHSARMGYMIEVAKIIFERKGHNIDYQVNSWIKSIENVRNSKATGLVATTKLDAPDFIFPQKSMGTNKDCFYVRAKDLWEFNEISDLKNRQLATSEGYAYSATLTAYINENPKKVQIASGKNTLIVNLKKLDEGRVDTIVENPFVFNYMVKEGKSRDKYEEAGCTEENDLYIAFSPKNPRSKEFAKILTEGIEELRKDGTLDKIISKYSLKDWR
ncbi:MAG: transporter substrate-binding domain-containing protein [Bacteriovorax sp.]|nr:transporter substrate-binding domain-containing protein [Bacteriovorax sp.]